METKLERNPLGHNSLRDASYQNPGMVLNGKRPSWRPIGDVSCHDLCTVSKEQGSDHCFLSCMLHWHIGVVKNVQGLPSSTSSMGAKGKEAI